MYRFGLSLNDPEDILDKWPLVCGLNANFTDLFHCDRHLVPKRISGSHLPAVTLPAYPDTAWNDLGLTEPKPVSNTTKHVCITWDRLLFNLDAEVFGGGRHTVDHSADHFERRVDHMPAAQAAGQRLFP